MTEHAVGCLQSQNQLQGSLPSSLDVPKLAVLDVSRNQLTGVLPSWPAGEDLAILLYNHNRFTGSIPAPPPINQLGNKRRLAYTRPTPPPLLASQGRWQLWPEADVFKSDLVLTHAAWQCVIVWSRHVGMTAESRRRDYTARVFGLICLQQQLS